MAFTVGNRGGDFEKVPLGPAKAICISVHDLGWINGSYGVFQKCIYLFETEHKYTTGDRAGKRMLISMELPITDGAKSKMWGFLGSWYSKDFSQAERQTFDLETPVGRTALLGIVEQKAKNSDKVYHMIGSIMPLPQSMGPITQETPKGYVPEFIQKKIDEAQANRAPMETDAKPSNWTPEAEDKPVQTHETRREDLRKRFKTIVESNLFLANEIELMKAKVKDNAANIPSLEFIIKKYENEMNVRLPGSTKSEVDEVLF